MSKILDFSFCLLILLWVLPSGQIMGFPIKMLVFAICFLAIVLTSISRRKILKINNRILYLLFAIVAMWLWMIIAVINNYTEGLASMLQYVGSFMGTLILADLYFINFSTEHSIERLGRLFYISVIGFVAFKIVFEILFILNIISYETILFVFNDVLSAEVMTLHIPFGSTTMCRISTNNDLIPIILLGFDLIFRKRSYFVRLITLIIAFFFSMITYSRLIFLQFAAILLCFLFYSFRRHGQRKKTLLRLVVTILFSIMLIITLSQQNTSLNSSIQTYIRSRFSSDAVSSSDAVRQTQFGYLLNGFKEHPILGNGFASYVKGYVRSERIFSYELEYLSFLYQFGIIGFLIIIVGTVVIAYNFMVSKTSFSKHRMFLGVNFALWAFRPLFNPYLFSSISAMVIIVTYLLAFYYSPSSLEIYSSGKPERRFRLISEFSEIGRQLDRRKD